jgi:hypothetical protein
MEKIADFIVAFAVKPLYSGGYIGIITFLRDGFVFGQLFVIVLIHAFDYTAFDNQWG